MSVLNNSEVLLLAADVPTGYTIERSLRFNSADSAYLSRTPASAGNRKTWSWAGWVKRSGTGTFQELFGAGSNNLDFSFNSDNLTLYEYNGSTVLWQRTTTAVYRDFSSWYHIVLAVDTTQATAANRVRLYVNGNEVTVFSVSTNPTQNSDTYVNSTIAHYIGRQSINNRYLDAYLADVHLIDGQALTPTSFGEFDVNNVWQPKAYTGSYGTNGFQLKFADNSAATAAALGKDTSGNGNNWTPTNFSVADVVGVTNVNYTNSNATATAANTSEKTVILATARSTGKWYAEFTRNGIVNTSDEVWGLVTNNSSYPGDSGTLGVGDATSRDIFNSWGSGTASSATLPSLTNGDIIQIAVDFDAKKVWWGVNNVWSNSANPSTGTNPHFYAWSGTPSWKPGVRLYYTNNAVTINSTTTYSPPTGFSNWGDSTWPLTQNAGNDSLVDVPTNGTEVDTGAGGQVRGNYCTLNPLGLGGGTLSNGNLSVSTSTDTATVSAFAMTTGKWYWEVTLTTSSNPRIGVYNVGAAAPAGLGATANGWCLLNGPSRVFNNGSTTNYGTFSGNNGDVVMLAYDADAGKLWYGVNGSWFASGNPATGANPSQSSVTGSAIVPASSSGTGANVHDFNFGQRPFAYTAPSGFKALCTANLPTPNIANGATAMDVVLYTGTGATLTPTSTLGFSPDLVWIKSRSAATDNTLYDSVRGAQARLESNTTDAEVTSDNGLTAFNSNGFTLGTLAQVNTNAATYAGWTWDAGSSTVTNTSGSISSQVRASTTNGCSVVTYTGTGANATVGHGLGVAPGLVIVKRRNVASNWQVRHTSIAAANSIQLNLTNRAAAATTVWNSTAPTSTVFSIGTDATVNASGGTYVAYCFAPVAGYSAFGSYTGNGSTDGPFVFLGFRPAVVLLKNSTTEDFDAFWIIVDDKREGYNVDNDPLYADRANAEGTSDLIDITSNGFKLRTATSNVINTNAATTIYAAWASSPFAYARAR